MNRLSHNTLLSRSLAGPSCLRVAPAPWLRHSTATSRFASTSPSTTAQKASNDKRKAYSHTLLLPRTTFPLKHKDIVAAEKKYRYKTSDELYKVQVERHDNPLFVLHDGPPYANGHLHMGHSLNRVLKDIINRYQVIRGKRVHYIPGWDCHGLPIEHKALAALGKSHTSLQPLEVRAEARKVALDAIEIQKAQMRALAVMADWDNEKGTYRTLDHDYEIRQLRLFKTMVERGLVKHRLRPTYYSPSNRTALAEAELKYTDGHKSKSVYVGFPVEEGDMSEGLRKVWEEDCGKAPLELAIWTTTPWSLPGNMGVAVHDEMDYVIGRTEAGRTLVLAADRVIPMEGVLGSMEILGRLSGSQLVGTRYTHLFQSSGNSLTRPAVFSAKHVTATAGTGLVHSAPAHGHEDYEAFIEAGALPEELRCPIDDDGRFTQQLVGWSKEEGVKSLVGEEVLGGGTDKMVDLLRSTGSLLAEQPIEHRYPYDWKSKKPIIVRATPQWFADLDEVKQTAIAALQNVKFHPVQSKNRLESFVTSRNEWCISRQRSWGVPIPALFGSDGPIMDSETLDHVLGVLDQKGVDHWWSGPVEDFIPPKFKGQKLTRGYDTLDVWFDSGSSWTMLHEHKDGEPPADVYLEGSDQHRGWFQSSLLTKLISSPDGQAPYRTVITHGFVMDEEGEKMSKSAGNGISPMELIHGSEQNGPAHGTDVLRLWAASVDYTSDASIGPSSIAQATEVMRRLRNATRFLLANTANSEPLSLTEVTLSKVDAYILHELAQLEASVEEAYEAYAFNRVLQSTTTFISSTLSAFYFDIIKDVLYCDASNSPARNAVIAVLQHTLQRIVRILAPITPHLAEELHAHSHKSSSQEDAPSVFLNAWHPDSKWLNSSVKEEATTLLALRTTVQKLVEEARAAQYVIIIL
ncbi:isoleucine-tRNA ligase [Kwoniella heveanensis CBS 569]|nr:isoleucine-tRNA ligase [Kwoniella heveanensis CBS 569]